MFMDSVLTGLKSFGYWEIYAALVEYLALYLGLFFVASLSSRKGCMISLVPMLTQMLAVIVLVITISPIILGLDSDAAWVLPFKVILVEPASVIFLMLKLLIATVLLALIPIYGRILTFHTLLAGGIILCFVLDGAGLTYGNPFPPFLVALGIAVLTGLLSVSSTIITAYVIAALKLNAVIGGAIIALTASLLGLIPLFIYAAWLGSTIT